MTSLSAPDGFVATRPPYRWTVPVCALVGLGLGLLLLGLRGPTYESIARVTVNNPIGTMQDEAVAAGATVIIDAAASTLGFVPDVSIEANEVAGLLTITSRADTPEKAADGANAVANTYVQAQTSAAVGVATPAEANDDPVGAGALSHMLIGSLVGAVAGLVLSGVMMVSRRRPANRRPPRPAQPPAWVPTAQPDNAKPDKAKPPSAPTDEARARDPRHGPPTLPAPPVDLAREADGVSRREPSTPEPATPPEFAGLASDAAAKRRQRADLRAKGSPFVSALSSAFATAAAEAERDRPTRPQNTDDVFSEAVDRPGPAPATGSALEFDDMVTTRWLPGSPSMHGLAAPTWTNDVASPGQTTAADASEKPTSGRTATRDLASGDDPSEVPVASGSLSPVPDTPVDRPSLSAMSSSVPDRTIEEEERYLLVAVHELEVAELRAGYEKTIAALRSELSGLNRQLRAQATQLKRLDGNDQHRVGDLEAQIVALDAELASTRDQLERERIAHTLRLTEEQVALDRALDNVRREYREELAKHEQIHRANLSEHRADLDRILAEDRAKHAEALEAQHRDYETALELEREHHAAEVAAIAERHHKELSDAREHAHLELARQAAQHKETIASLRDTTEVDAEIADLQRVIGSFRTEIATLQQQARHAAAENAAANQRLLDQLAVALAELTSERDRNAALRADVLRRSAEAHEVVDRALEERTAQLAELEAAVARQREYSDARVREVSAAAEERARQSALREADLSAKVSRLERELAQLESQRASDDGDKPRAT